MAIVASKIRLRRSRCASEPSSDSASTATFITSRGCAVDPLEGCPELVWAGPGTEGVICPTAHFLASSLETIRMPSANFSPPCRRDTGMSCCDGIRLDGGSLALLEHVLVLRAVCRAAAFPVDRGVQVGTTITDEQIAARELVRDWAAGSGTTAAVRDIEQGEPKA